MASQCVFTCPTGVVDGGGPIVQCGADSGVPGCFDLTQSSDHCGSCGTSCEGGNTCNESQCCPPGNRSCGGTCINVQTDPNNCGGCDAGCPSPAQCSAGTCTGYTKSNPTTAFIDACTLTGHVATMTNAQFWTFTDLMPLPFSFTFYGTAVTQYWLQSQGTMGLGPPMTGIITPDGYPACGTAGQGDPSLHYPAILAFGEETMGTGAQGICYATTGATPNQQFVVTWEQATLGDDTGSALTFSVVLTQTTNTVDLMYKTVASSDGGIDPTVAGANATVGMQAFPGGGPVHTAVSCDATFITATPLDIRLTPVP
jgi:hypothetical protein